jgi:hypothetical protein
MPFYLTEAYRRPRAVGFAGRLRPDTSASSRASENAYLLPIILMP